MSYLSYKCITMKKISALILAFFIMNISVAFAQENTQAVTTSASITSTVENTQTVSDTESSQQSEEVVYNYYFSPTCGWCQKLDAFLEKNDAYEKLTINKFDVRSQADKMMFAAEEHGLSPSSVGTPFVTYGPSGTGSYIDGGFYGAVEHFSQAMGIESPIASPEEQKNKSFIIVLIGLLVIVAPLAYLGLKK